MERLCQKFVPFHVGIFHVSLCFVSLSALLKYLEKSAAHLHYPIFPQSILTVQF